MNCYRCVNLFFLDLRIVLIVLSNFCWLANLHSIGNDDVKAQLESSEEIFTSDLNNENFDLHSSNQEIMATDLTDEEISKYDLEMKDSFELTRQQQGYSLKFQFVIPTIFYTVRGMYMAYLRQYEEIVPYHVKTLEKGQVGSFPQNWKFEQKSIAGKRRHFKRLVRFREESSNDMVNTDTAKEESKQQITDANSLATSTNTKGK